MLRGECLYRVRRHDGTVLEGHARRNQILPTWKYTIQRADKILKHKEIVALWGLIQMEILEKGPERSLIVLPDDKVALVNNIRIHEDVPETIINA